MRTLEQYLTDTQPGLNKNANANKKRGLYSGLGYNYTHPDPNFMKLSDNAKRYLDKLPKFLKDWQADGMRGGIGQLFQNPVGRYVGGIASSSGLMCEMIIDDSLNYDEIADFALGRTKKSVTNNTLVKNAARASSYSQDIKYPELKELFETSLDLLVTSIQFGAHTDRLSNVESYDTAPPAEPHYKTCTLLGSVALKLSNQVDNLDSAEPVLGCFTSLYIEKEMQEYYILSQEDFETANDAVQKSFDAEIQKDTYLCFIEPEEVDVIMKDFQEIRFVMNKRMEHDKNMFNNLKNVIKKYDVYKDINSIGEAQRKLIDNYIGTQKLKDSLKTTDGPQKPIYKVTVDYFGKITYTSTTPDRNTFTIPTTDTIIRTPNTTVNTTITTLPNTGVPGDTIVVTDPTNPNTNTTIYTYTGTTWIVDTQKPNTNITLTMDEKINAWVNSTRYIKTSGTTLALTPGAMIYYDTYYGIWTSEKSIKIENIGGKDYIYSNIYNEGVPDINIRYTMSNAPNNVIAIGQTTYFNIATINYQVSSNAKYDTVWMTPDVDIPYKIINNNLKNGILMPNAVSVNVGSTTERLLIYKEAGPYTLIPNEYGITSTWHNDTLLPVTISSIENITDNVAVNDMTITFNNIATPYIVNANSSVVWYANVTPMVEFPNTSTFKISTSDGQERLLTIGIDRGNVDDSYLFNEKINTNPDTVLTNNVFDIRVYDGKANTYVNYTGPFNSGSLLLDSNGYVNIANNSIDANGIYTWVFEFANTSHKRTLTKVIYS